MLFVYLEKVCLSYLVPAVLCNFELFQMGGWMSWAICPLKIFRLHGCIYAYKISISIHSSAHVKWDVVKSSLLYNLSFSLTLSLFHSFFLFCYLFFSDFCKYFSQLLRINVICRLCYWNQPRTNTIWSMKQILSGW